MLLKYVGTSERPNGVKVGGRICTAGVVFKEEDVWEAQQLLSIPGFEKVDEIIVAPAQTIKKKRGRPRKVKAIDGVVDQSGNAQADSTTSAAAGE